MYTKNSQINGDDAHAASASSQQCDGGSDTARQRQETKLGVAGYRSQCVGLALVNEDGAWMAVNDFLCHALDTCEEHLVGRQLRDSFASAEVLALGRSSSVNDDSIKSGCLTLRVRLRRSDGGLKWLRGTSEQVYPSERCCYFLTLTHIEPPPEPSPQQCDSVAAAQQTLDVVAHEIRTPLTTVLLSGDMLQSTTSDPATERSIKRLMKSATQAMTIADDLIDCARWSKGKTLNIVPQTTHLGALVTQLLDGYALSHSKQIITCSQAGDLVGEWDPVRLAQVISNLLNNALAHVRTEEEPVAVRLRGLAGAVTIEVHNGGDAIAASDLERIFEPLFTTKSGPHNANLGLGLLVVKMIVESHHGTISVRSTQALGTCFFITLPRHVAQGPSN